MGEDETTDPDVGTAAHQKMGTREYDLQEQRDARQERTDMQETHRQEKADLLATVERLTRSKNYIIYALIAGNLFQGAMLLGKNLDFEGYGTKISTGEGTEDAAGRLD